MRGLKRSLGRLTALALALVMCLGMAEPALAAETAATVRLVKTEGTVTVTTSSGKEQKIREDMRLYSGYHVKTAARSYAYVSLDSEKAAKVDASSDLELRSKGKKLELLAASGSVFFDVSAPLKDDETLNIRTATMVTGIRGTSGWVEAVDAWHSRVYILEGTVEAVVTNPVTGQSKSATVTGGQVADCYVYDASTPGDKVAIIRSEFTREGVPGFVLAEVADTEGLAEKIYEGSGIDLRDLTEEEIAAILEADESGAAAGRPGSAAQAKAVKDPVWKSGNGAGGTGTSGTPYVPAAPAVETTTSLTTDNTVAEISRALTASDVTVVKGTKETLTLDADLTVPADRKLTVAEDVAETVLTEGATLTVAGTMDIRGSFTDRGRVVVTSSDTLIVGGVFTVADGATVELTETGHLVAENDLVLRGSLETAGNVEVKGTALLPETGSVDLSCGTLTISDPKTVDVRGSITVTDGTLDAAGGLSLASGAGLTLKGGTVSVAKGVILTSGGTVTLEGGVLTSDGEKPTLTVENGAGEGVTLSAGRIVNTNEASPGAAAVSWEDAGTALITEGTGLESAAERPVQDGEGAAVAIPGFGVVEGADGTHSVGVVSAEPASDPEDDAFTVTAAAAGAGKGSVSVSAEKARAGETVRITAAPEEGSELASLAAVTRGGEKLDITDNVFTMPAGDVIVIAAFEPAVPEPGETPTAEEKYTVNLLTEASYGGTVFITDEEGAPVAEAAAGQTVRLVGVPDSDYDELQVEIYRLNGDRISTMDVQDGAGNRCDNQFGFIMPDEPVVFLFFFEPFFYNVFTSTPRGGRVALRVMDHSSFFKGEPVSFMMVPEAGYAFKNAVLYKVNNDSGKGEALTQEELEACYFSLNVQTGDLSISMPDYDLYIDAQFEPLSGHMVRSLDNTAGAGAAAPVAGVNSDEAITVFTGRAEQGQNVFFRVVPQNGQMLETLWLCTKDENDDLVIYDTYTESGSQNDLVRKEDGYYVATMPDADLYLLASYTTLTYTVFIKINDGEIWHGGLIRGNQETLLAARSVLETPRFERMLRSLILPEENTHTRLLAPGGEGVLEQTQDGIVVTVLPGASVRAGTEMTVTVRPEGTMNMDLSGLKVMVMGVSGVIYPVTQSGSSYEFNMPAENVGVFVDTEDAGSASADLKYYNTLDMDNLPREETDTSLIRGNAAMQISGNQVSLVMEAESGYYPHVFVKGDRSTKNYWTAYEDSAAAIRQIGTNTYVLYLTLSENSTVWVTFMSNMGDNGVLVTEAEFLRETGMSVLGGAYGRDYYCIKTLDSYDDNAYTLHLTGNALTLFGCASLKTSVVIDADVSQVTLWSFSLYQDLLVKGDTTMTVETSDTNFVLLEDIVAEGSLTLRQGNNKKYGDDYTLPSFLSAATVSVQGSLTLASGSYEFASITAKDGVTLGTDTDRYTVLFTDNALPATTNVGTKVVTSVFDRSGKTFLIESDLKIDQTVLFPDGFTMAEGKTITLRSSGRLIGSVTNPNAINNGNFNSQIAALNSPDPEGVPLIFSAYEPID